MERRELRPLLFGLVLCATVRLGFALTRDHLPTRHPYDGYKEIAENVLAGKGFTPTPLRHFSLRVPGYPLFVAAVWGVGFGSARFLALTIAQVGLSVATCGLLYSLARVHLGARAALAAGVLFALSPSYTVFCTQVYTETMQIFLIALAAFLVSRLTRAPGPGSALGLGVVWGVAGLTRPEATYLIPLLATPLLFVPALKWRTRLGYACLVVAANVAVLAPWVARNHRIYGAFVLHVPSGGSALFGGMYPYPPMFGRGWAPGTQVVPVWGTKEYQAIIAPYRDRDYQGPYAEEVVAHDVRDFRAIDRDLGRAARSFVVDHKRMVVRNLLYHLTDMWHYPAAWTYDPEPSQITKACWLACYLLGALFLTIGLGLAWKRKQLRGAPIGWLLFMAGHIGMLLMICTEPRYQASSAPFLFVFGGVGAAALFDRITGRSRVPSLRTEAAETRRVPTRF